MRTDQELNIVLVDVNKVIPYWRNPRRNDKTVEWLCEIIPAYGFNVPIVLDKQNVIVKGHARLKAAKRLGMDQVPCIYSENDDETNKADRIADNRIQEMSYWDLARLEMEYQRIGKLKFDKLFHPEDVERIDYTPDTDIGFEATSLEDGYDYGDDNQQGYEDRFKEFKDGNEPVGDYGGEDVRGEDEDAYRGSEERSGDVRIQDGRKVLKTICPYCGADAFIRL